MPHKQADHNDLMQDRASLTKFAWLSIGAAVATILLKTGAYFLTGSVGLLSDAIESLVNLVGAVMALLMLIIAARPADDDHVYGHTKAEYFASSTEGLLILGAAIGIISAAVQRLLQPREIEQLGLGLLVSAAASLINLVVARILLNAGKRRRSITLEADAQHLMTDVWTSVAGFMDEALPEQEQKLIQTVMGKYREKGVAFHALRTRQAAARRFMSVHVLVPGDWTVHDAHHIAEDFENDIRAALGGAITVFTHLEPAEDEISMDDIYLDR